MITPQQRQQAKSRLGNGTRYGNDPEGCAEARRVLLEARLDERIAELAGHRDQLTPAQLDVLRGLLTAAA